jgi:DNA-binding NarL/FixJ family response regulator
MKLLSCDDHALFRAGLRLAVEELDPEGVLIESGTATQLFEQLEAHSDFDLLLLDLGLPDLAGIDLLERVRDRFPATPVVIVSASEDRREIRQALALGAMGFISKSSSDGVLVGALRLVLAGGVYVPPALLEDLRDPEPEPTTRSADEKQPAAKRLAALTARQQEVVELIAKGLTNREIAGVLGIAETTAKHHAAAAYSALDVTNRTEAAVVIQSLLKEED